MVCDKHRIRFRKTAALRLISHHDLMRCFERMLRRAGLPFHSSEGFNPKPRMVFALSLGLGIVGADEIVELELEEELPAGEVCDRPDYVDIVGTGRVPDKENFPQGSRPPRRCTDNGMFQAPLAGCGRRPA